MNRCAAFVLALTLGWLGVSRARAEFNIGDTAKLTYKAMDNSLVDLERLRGKIVVITFWSTWSDPSMREVPHMVALNRMYGKDGLQIIGVSLDRDSDKAKLEKTIREKDMPWPQWFEPQATTQELAKWSDLGVPFAVIVGKDGKILWKGHPKELDTPFLRVWKGETDLAAKPPEPTPDPKATDPKTPDPAKTPDPKVAVAPPKVEPIVDPKTVTKNPVEASCDQIEKNIKDKNFDTAFNALTKIPAASRMDAGALGTRIKGFGSQLSDYAEQRIIPDAEKSVEKENYMEAIQRYQAIMVLMPGTPAASKAAEKLKDLLSMPMAREEARRFIRAQKPELLTDPPQAGVVPPPVAAPGGQPVPVLNADPNAENQAKKDLEQANKLLASGQLGTAQASFQRIIQKYPGTPSAQAAQDALNKMKKP